MLDWLFGSSETKNELPDWIVGPATEMLQRSVDMGKAGYMPWSGPVVAALDPAQVGAMRNNSAMAAAFGMDSTMPNIREATTYGDGTRGYSSMPLYNQNMNWLQKTRPGQMDYYNSFFVDPVTGVEGSRMEQASTGPAPGYDAGGGQLVWTMHPDKFGMDIWSDQAVQRRINSGGGPNNMGQTSQASGIGPVQGPMAPGQSRLGFEVNNALNSLGVPQDGILGGIF